MRQRKLRNGKTLRDNFEDKYIPEPNSGCWFWIGSLAGNRYGKIRPDTGERTDLLAHRVSYELFKGTIPPDHIVCHRCDNVRCVNPDHLFIGTHKTNHTDAINKGRIKVAGKHNPRAFLSEQDVVRIRTDGRPANVVAREYGVWPSTIHRIWNRETWTSLP